VRLTQTLTKPKNREKVKMNGTSDIKIEDHHNHEKDNIKVFRDLKFWGKLRNFAQQYFWAKILKIGLYKNFNV